MSHAKSAGADFLLRETLRPSLLLCLSLSLSSLLSYCKDSSLLIPVIVCAVLLISAAALCCQRGKAASSIPTAAVYLVICAVFAGALYLRANSTQAGSSFSDCTAFITTVEERTPYRYKDRIILSLSPADGSRHTDKAVAWVEKSAPFHEGDRLALSADPVRLDSSSEGMIRQGIHFSVQLRDNWSYISKTGMPLRAKIRDRLVAHNEKLYDEKTSGVISALMLGDSYFVDKHTTYDFTRAGVLHILAASGTHVVIIAAIPLFLFSLLRIPSSLSYAATSLMLAAYYYLTCMPVSLLRACVMFWIITLCKLLRKKDDSVNALYLSASVILLLHPYELFSLGFQLSYGATFGVIVFQKRFRRALPKLPFKISDSLAMTFAAQVAVLPILCVSVGELNFTGIISNIFLIPGTGLAFLASIITDCISLIFPAAGALAASAVTQFMQLNLAAAHILARLPGHFPAPDAPFWLLIPYAGLCFPLLARKLPAWTAGSFIAASVLCTFIPLKMMTKPPAQQISIIDKAERRAFITCGDKALIYGGVRSKKESDDIKNMLKKRGYCTASLYISDFSGDSLRQTAALIRSMPVETVIISSKMPLDRRSLPLLDALDLDGIRVVFERASPSKNDCQYAAKVYEMKSYCESVLNDNGSSRGG